ncbi:MAG: NADH-quinone oxidoreductase subunit M [Ignavibacteriae bacterium]|nr:MAG: NADH-quinone oxidoreductase subunit M [Ignavibacteriota bacterium]
MIVEMLLTTIIFLPLLFAVAVLFLPKENEQVIKWMGLGGTALTFLLSLFLYFGFDSSLTGFQFEQRLPWISSLNIGYHVGIDGMSLLLILLTTFLTPLTLLGTWNSIHHQIKNYTSMILLLEAGMIGVFASLDLFLFYIFWEAMLIPMYFIIGIWGGQNRIYAAVKFFLYTLMGSLLMLVAIISLAYFASTVPGGRFTTDLTDLYRVAPQLPVNLQMWMFAAFGLSFAIKVPLWPLHTWLPDAHVEAPTAGSVILAGILLKMGTYGFIRFNLPLFAEASQRAIPLMCTLAVIGIVYGALVAMVQTDIKKLVAYSSVSHLGFVMLGIFSMTEEGLQGAIIQMVNHGLSTGALFLLVGMIYDRTHTRLISDYGGVAKVMPVFAAFFMIVSLSSIGLPGLNGFVGEFLVMIGSFKSTLIDNRIFTAIAGLGIIFSAVYMLWMYQRVMVGPAHADGLYNGHPLTDLTRREIAALVPIVLFIVWIGVYPKTFLGKSAPMVKQTVEQMESVKHGSQVKILGSFQNRSEHR